MCFDSSGSINIIKYICNINTPIMLCFVYHVCIICSNWIRFHFNYVKHYLHSKLISQFRSLSFPSRFFFDLLSKSQYLKTPGINMVTHKHRRQLSTKVDDMKRFYCTTCDKLLIAAITYVCSIYSIQPMGTQCCTYRSSIQIQC